MSDLPQTELKPCPFCAGVMEEVTDEDGHYFVHPGRKGMQRADCWLADAWVSDEPSGEGSIGEWNTRASPAPRPITGSTLYLDRSEVRAILIGQPEESLYITEEVLREIDALRIFTRGDLAAPVASCSEPLEVIKADLMASAETVHAETLADFLCYTEDRIGPGCDELAIAQALLRKFTITLSGGAGTSPRDQS